MTTNTTPFTAAAAPTPPAQASGQAPSAAMPDEIEGLRAHVALLKAALAQAERENDELRAQPAAATAAPTPSEWDVRGRLAASLTCWHRLTGQEAAELVALFQAHPPHQPKRTVTYVCPVCAASLERQE